MASTAPLSLESAEWRASLVEFVSRILDLVHAQFAGSDLDRFWQDFWSAGYCAAQVGYLLTFAAFFYFMSRTVNWVDGARAKSVPEEELPFIVLAYPVLRENAQTMYSTFTALARTDYPRSRYSIIAVVNRDDEDTVAALERLQKAFSFVEIMRVPATDDPGWEPVWRAWESNEKAYWYHRDKTKGVRDLPPKKTRQLIYLFYRIVEGIGTNWVLDYIDADSIPPANHFRLAAEGLRHYDVLQSTNVAGNLLDSLPASLHAFDHMCWDGFLYPHMSANGGHPYYVLGKGLFYRARDLVELGCFNPWIAIEDPEIGLRLWTNGKRLGVIRDPLVEEVPRTFLRGVLQRNRWMCGFYQTLGRPLKRMGMSPMRRMQARLNLVPVLSLPINLVGLPTGVYAAYLFLIGANPFPVWAVYLSCLNIGLYLTTMFMLYRNTWRRSGMVLDGTWSRISYLLRVNPLFLFIYHTIWTLPILIGFFMFVADRGKVWSRTAKYDAVRAFADKDQSGR